MRNNKHVVMIHGTWSNGPDVWGKMAPAMENRGFCFHTPTLRYHDLPFLEGAIKIADLSLLDYVEDLSQLIQQLETPPLIAILFT